MSRLFTRAHGLLGAALAAALACSSPSAREEGAPAGAADSALRTSSLTNPTPFGSPNPDGSFCPLGNGTLDSQCARTSPAFLGEVNAAIDLLAEQRPEIFVLGAPDGTWIVKDIPAYYAGVVANLQARGLCANYDLREVQVKNGNEFSEQYDILLTTEQVRRGGGSYRSTCTPAIFPVDAAEFIDAVRVAYYDIQCPNGQEGPRNGAGVLPLGCVGLVTASPKKKDNSDVDSRIHGPEIRWFLHEGEGFVVVDEFPDQAFNRQVRGLSEGKFMLCAVVKGVQGCLTSTVVPAGWTPPDS